MTTPDPAAIDLDVIRGRYCSDAPFSGGSICRGDISILIAAVEALQERVAELEKQHVQDMKDAFENGKDTKHAWDLKEVAEARVVELEEREEDAATSYEAWQRAVKGGADWRETAKAEAARVAELERALEELVSIVDGLIEDQVCPHRVDSFTLDPVRTILSATREDALARQVELEAQVAFCKANHGLPSRVLGRKLGKS